jgi:hypothetical protein
MRVRGTGKLDELERVEVVGEARCDSCCRLLALDINAIDDPDRWSEYIELERHMVQLAHGVERRYCDSCFAQMRNPTATTVPW